MKNLDTYIKITEDDDNIDPTDDQLSQLNLDNYSEEEYNTPYTSYNEDIPDFGDTIEALRIFDDR